MSMKLIMLRGLPASGKSTKAQELVKPKKDVYRVNRDCLRTMLHLDQWSNKRESVTVDIAQMAVGHLLSQGHTVVMDDTNLGEKHERTWRMMADMFGADFEIIDMMDEVTVADCILRNADRENGVPEQVIKNMALQYQYNDYDKVIICDIDGTIADCSHREHHVTGDKKDWKAFFAGMADDTPRTEVWDEVKKLSREENAEIILVSARPEDYREVTEQWLRGNEMDDFVHLLMRRSGDKRPDVEVKSEIYHRYLRPYDIIKVFDDRPAVIRMWKEKELDVVDVGNGEEF